MRYVIYKITNQVNNKIYIGQTVQPLHERLRRHASKYSMCRKLHNSIQKHGINNFIIEEIDTTDTQEKVDELEKFYIKTLNTIEAGYNLKEGGANGLLSDETKEKISESLQGHIVSEDTKQKLSLQNTGSNNPNYGLKRSDETKSKTSGALKGRVISWSDKISASCATKFNEEIIKDIFEKYLSHPLEERSKHGFQKSFCIEKAKELNTTHQYILKILNGKSWKYIYSLYANAIKS